MSLPWASLSEGWLSLRDEGLEIHLRARPAIRRSGRYATTEVAVRPDGALAVLTRSCLVGEAELRFEIFDCVEDLTRFYEFDVDELMALHAFVMQR